MIAPNLRAKLDGVPVQAVAHWLTEQFDEIIIVGRNRPQLDAVGQGPEIFMAGKGDFGDQIGLAKTLELRLTTTAQMNMVGADAPEG